MFIRKYWIPLLVFIVAIAGVGIYLLSIQPAPEPVIIIKPAEPLEKTTAEKSEVETEAPSDTSQGGHFHADGTWHGEPHAPAAESSSTDIGTQTQRKPLTYHAELLESNPVEALRLQAEERGHWSAQWIPPFPPEDTEAAVFARNAYLVTYYRSIGDLNNPEYIKTWHEYMAQMDVITYDSDYSIGNARPYDLMKLSWVTMDEPVPAAGLPSDYF